MTTGAVLAPPHSGRPSVQAVSFAAFAAGLLPMAVAFSVPPIPSLFNEALALLTWGGLMALLGGQQTLGLRSIAGAKSCWAALCLIVLAAWLPPLRFHTPGGYAAATTGLLVAGMLLVRLGIQTSQAGQLPKVLQAFCWGTLALGLLNVLVGCVQVFRPDWTGAVLIPPLRIAGRSIGTIRQSNHLAMLLIWALLAWGYLCTKHAIPPWARWLGSALFAMSICLSGSRFGLVALVLACLWATLDRRLPKPARQVLMSGAPLAFAGLAMMWLTELGVAERMGSAAGEGGASRWRILADSLHLLIRHPWLGVGWGEFNFAWTLTPRDWVTLHHVSNAHNALVQMAVELGLPLALGVTALLAHSLLRAVQASTSDGPADMTLASRFGLAIALVVLLQSQFEYSLWYAYFLLPTAFFLGSALGTPTDGQHANSAEAPAPKARHQPLRIGGLLMVLGGAFLLFDFMKVVQIFIPPNEPAPLALRIEEGQRSLFFRPLADYALATSTPMPPADAFPSAARATLDERLLYAWAQHLHRQGDDERALYLIDRARMFLHFDKDGRVMASCSTSAPGTLGFPCGQATRAWTFEDFRP